MQPMLARSQGPASGVDYFSDTGQQQGVANFNPGQSSLTADSEAPGAGISYTPPETGFTPTPSGFGGGRGRGRDFGMDGREGGISPGTLGMVGYGLNALGQVTGSPDLGMAGSMLGATGAAAQGDFGPMGGFMGGMIGGPTGAALGGAAGMALSGTGTPSRYGAVAGGLLGGAPGAALGRFAGDVYSGNVNPNTVGNLVGTLALGPLGGPIGSAIGGGLFGTADSLSPMGVPQPGYAGLFGTDMGRKLGTISFTNPSTPSGLGVSEGQGLGVGPGVVGQPGFTGRGVGQANVGGRMGGAQGVTGSVSGGTLGSGVGPSLSGGGGLGLKGPTSTATGLGSTGLGGGGVSSGGGRSSGGSSGVSAQGGNLSRGFRGSGGWADGGLIGHDQPGLTQRYMDGGQVQGGQQPMLAMGYADGGGVQMGATPSNASVTQQVNEILRNPQMKQRITAHAQQLMASGELTPQEVQVMAQVAEAAMYNPSLYPQLRQFVAEQGMSPLPPAYDPSVIVKIMAVARALQEMQPMTPPGEVPPTDQAQVQPPVPGMARGGMIKGPGTGRSDSIGTVNETTGEPVRVANNEYIIPEHVVRAKGREFFDNLLRRYADVPKEQA